MKIRKLLLSSLILGSITLTAKDYLPQNLFLHVKTNKLGKSLDDVNAFAVEAVKGTRLQSKMQPGMLKMLLPMALGLPGGAINMEKPVHLLVGLPKDKVNGDASFGVIFPLDNAKTSLDTAMGVKKNANGTYTLANGLNVAPSLQGYVAFSDNQMNTLKFAETFKNNKFPKNNRGTTVSAIYDINKLMREVGSEAKTELLEEVEEGLAEVSKQFPVPGIELCLKNAVGELFSLAEQTKALQVNLNLSTKGIDYHVLVAPQKESELSEISTIISGYKVGFNLLQKQLDPAQISITSQYDKALNDKLSTIFKRVMKPLEKGQTKPFVEAMHSTFETYGRINGENSTTFNFETATKNQGTTILSVDNSEQFCDDYIKLIKNAPAQTKTLFESMNLPLTSDLTEVYHKKNINGASVSSYKVSYKLKEKGTLPPELSMPEDLTYCVASINNKHAIVCWGSDSEKQLKNVLARYKSNSQNSTRASQLLKSSSHNGLFAMAVDPLAIVKAFASDSNNNMPAELRALAAQSLTNLQPLKTPIIITGGSVKKLLSLKAQIPTELINKLISIQ